MANTVGVLTIEMAANIARLQKDMNSAKNTVDGAMSAIKGSVDLAIKALGALGIAAGVNAFAGYIKNAINAADAMDEISQRTGIAVKDISGLQTAFKFGGMAAEDLQKAMAKLASAAGSNSDVFKTLNVDIKNSDGTLKGLRQLFGEVADSFAGMEDGTLKTAKAIEIFGKSGADLVPILNLGSKGLAEFDQIAAKLGLTLDKETAGAAGKFNDTLDLISMAGQGMSRQIMTQALPALQAVAGAFFEAMTSGDKLQSIATALSIVLKGLATVALVAIEGVASAVKTIQFGFDAVSSALKGDFAAIGAGYKKLEQDIGSSMGGTIKGITELWKENGSQSVASMVNTVSAVKKATPQLTEEFTKQQEEIKKNQEAYKMLMDDIQGRANVLTFQAEQTDKLSDSQKLALKVMQDLQNGVLKLTDAEKIQLANRLENLLVLEESSIATENYRKAIADYTKDLVKQNESITDQIDKQQKANIEVMYGKEYVYALETAKLREQAASVQRQAALMAEAGYDAAVTEQLELQAQKLYELADAKEQGSFVEMAKKGQEEMKKMTDALATDMTRALMQGFESGKGFFDNLASYIKNRMMTLVAEEIVKPLMQPIAALIVDLMSPVRSAISSMVSALAAEIAAAAGIKSSLSAITTTTAGTTAATTAATNAATTAGTASTLTNIATGAGSLASGISAGAGALVGEAGISGGISAGVTAIGAGNIAGGVGTLMGTIGPLAIGAFAASQLIKGLEGGETRSGGKYTFDPSSGIVRIGGPSGGHIGGKEGNANVIAGINNTVNAINTELAGLGINLKVSKLAAGLESSGSGKGGVFVSGALSNGLGFGDMLPSLNPRKYRLNRSISPKNAYEEFFSKLLSAASDAVSVGTSGKSSWSMIQKTQKTADIYQIEGYAAGGLHNGGLRLVGENGPEIEATGPARYFTAGQLMGNDVSVELRNLREENRAQSAALVSMQARMTRLLERWDGDGLPEERAVA